MEFRSIICPIEETDLSKKGEETAGYLGKLSGGRLILLNVVEKWYKSSSVSTDSKEWNDLHNEWLEDGRRLLRNVEQRLRKEGVVNIEAVLREGDPAYEIVALAKERHADIIVMATHNYAPVTKLFMGSVIDDVTRKAKCPVLWLF